MNSNPTIPKKESFFRQIGFWIAALYAYWVVECILLYFQIAGYNDRWWRLLGKGLVARVLKLFSPAEALTALTGYMAAAVVMGLGTALALKLARGIARSSDIPARPFHGAAFVSSIIYLYGVIIINVVVSPIAFTRTDLINTLLWTLTLFLDFLFFHLYLKRRESAGLGSIALWGLFVTVMVCLFGVWPWMDFHTTNGWMRPWGLALRIAIFTGMIGVYFLIMYVVGKRRSNIGERKNRVPRVVKTVFALVPLALMIVAAFNMRVDDGLDEEDVTTLTDTPPNVLLISMDTTRADSLSCYNPTRGHTPFIDSIAAQGALFEDARSPSPWTLSGHASMFTSLYPSAHGASWEYLFLKNDYVTIAEILKKAGYKTACFSSNIWVSPHSNVVQGFDYFRKAGRTRNKFLSKGRPLMVFEALAAPIMVRLYGNEWLGGGPARATRSKQVNYMVHKWVEDGDNAGGPSFIFVNYVDAHNPYLPRGRFKPKAPPGVNVIKVDAINRNNFEYFSGRMDMTPAEWEYFRKLYYACVTYEDSIIRELFGILENSGFMDNAIVIITADHGEYLGEHNQLYHLYGVHDAVIRVPLIVYAPGRIPAGVRHRGNAQTVDIPPTILELAGISYRHSGQFQGRSLVGPLKKNEPVRERAIAELMFPIMPLRMARNQRVPAKIFKKWEIRQRTITEGDLQLEAHSDREKDKFEDNPTLWKIGLDDVTWYENVTDIDGESAGFLFGKLKSWMNSFPHANPRDDDAPIISPAFEDELKALGYIK